MGRFRIQASWRKIAFGGLKLSLMSVVESSKTEDIMIIRFIMILEAAL